MQRRKRENEKRKQYERQQTRKESERHGGVWGKVRSTKKEPDRISVNQAAGLVQNFFNVKWHLHQQEELIRFFSLSQKKQYVRLWWKDKQIHEISNYAIHTVML